MGAMGEDPSFLSVKSIIFGLFWTEYGLYFPPLTSPIPPIHRDVSDSIACVVTLSVLVDAGWGRVVNVSSAASLGIPGPSNSAYATSKVAQNQFTRHLAAELEGTGVRFPVDFCCRCQY